jgi:hypothetical protein
MDSPQGAYAAIFSFRSHSNDNSKGCSFIDPLTLLITV